MKELVTVAIECTCDLFEGLEKFAHNKVLPEIVVELNGVSQSHKFTSNNETFRFVIDSILHTGTNFLTLSYKNQDNDVNYGNIRIRDVCIFGCTIGFNIFNCTFESYDGSEKNVGHTYIGKTGIWRFPIKSPMLAHHRGIVFG